MQKTFVTKKSEETQKLGEMLAEEFRNGGVICLSGDLGAGKTTFAQGFLKGLGAEGPYTSPTFLVMKEYHVENSKSKCQMSNQVQNQKTKIQKVYHIDAYRVGADDILALGWEEMTTQNSNVIIIEWAERISSIIPKRAIWINFEWAREDCRKIVLSNAQ